MKDRTDSKSREVDRETRLTGKWTGIGFAIVLIAAVLAAALLLMGSA